MKSEYILENKKWRISIEIWLLKCIKCCPNGTSRLVFTGGRRRLYGKHNYRSGDTDVEVAPSTDNYSSSDKCGIGLMYGFCN